MSPMSSVQWVSMGARCTRRSIVGRCRVEICTLVCQAEPGVLEVQGQWVVVLG